MLEAQGGSDKTFTRTEWLSGIGRKEMSKGADRLPHQ